MDATGGNEDGTDAIARDRIAYTIRDTARLLSLSQRKVRYMVEAGELVSIHIGRALRVHGASIDRFIAEHSRGDQS